MSILVVDDNTMLLSKIVRSLVLANQTVRSATNLAEARAILRDHPPKALCLDVQLPDGNGLDLLAEMRQAGSDLPTIIISGHHSEENRDRAERLGATGFLAKPFALSELHRRLAALLGDPPMVAGNATEPRPRVSRRGATFEPVAPNRLRRAKRAYATRRAEISIEPLACSPAQYAPQSGDLVLARVDKLIQHKRLVLDFTDCGAPSTYKLPIADCEAILETLVATLCAAEVDTILIEVADGILPEETRNLVQSATFARLVDNVIFAAGDALGAVGGVAWLRSRGLNLIGVSGALMAAPLAIREYAGLVDLPLLPLDTLNGGNWCPQGIGLAATADAQAA